MPRHFATPFVSLTMPLSHRRALLGMLIVTLLWSTAGVVSRQITGAQGLELTFWRSGFTGLALTLYFLTTLGPRGSANMVRAGGWPLWVSGAMWGVMFTCFMVALTLTTVANTLITMSLGPLLTALLARYTQGVLVPARTWWAILLAGLGVAWMYGHELRADPAQLPGTLVALGVPVAAAINWNVLRRSGQAVDLRPALWIGAWCSTALAFVMVGSWQATLSDLSWLAGLGVFQLALPCMMAVVLVRHLPAQEVSLLGLLEVMFGIAWAWLWAGERPSTQVLAGGGLVLLTLAVNEWVGWHQRKQTS